MMETHYCYRQETWETVVWCMGCSKTC